MICPSSSEDDSDGGDNNDNNEASNLANIKNPTRSPSQTGSCNTNSESTVSTVRVSSPSPSIQSEDVDGKVRQQEEEERRMRLQLYVFVIRCIACPFNAKQPTDTVKRQTKVHKQQLLTVKDRFLTFLAGGTQIPADDALKMALRSYYEVFLNSDRVMKMVQSGGCSSNDLRDVFKNSVEKRVKNLPVINGLDKETVLSSWMASFDAIYRGDDDSRRLSNRTQGLPGSEVILSKEQLYEMFQNILGIKRFEHQLVYNACQLDSYDEQVAAIRREIDGRSTAVQKIQAQRRFPKFYLRQNASEREVQKNYIHELHSQVNFLMTNLQDLPISKMSNDNRSIYPLGRLRRVQGTPGPLALSEQSSEERVQLSKSNVSLDFSLEVVVIEVRGLKSLASNKVIYCTMEADGGEKLQTDQAEASNPVWETQGDFATNCPLPLLKIKLFTESTGMLSIDDKELGKLSLTPVPNKSFPATFYKMEPSKSSADKDIKIKLSYRMDRPANMKHCGYLYAQGRTVWKKWKRRYFVLVQASQYNFAMCSFQERKSEPYEIMQIQGYTVDYTIPELDHEGGRAFFNAVKEGDSIMFASEDEQDRILWVQALYRATGQSHKPVPPTQVQKLTPSKQGQLDAPVSQFYADRVRRNGMDDFISADPCKYDHASLFELLQRLTLDHRLNDSYSCLGWFSPGQVFVLDEYCARYGVRGCHRHLCYLADLLDRADNGMMIDPTLLHYSYAFCLGHMDGQKPDGLLSITLDEKERSDEIKQRIMSHIKYQLTHFRYCFPFGRPKGALKATLTLLERVMMTNISTPVPEGEVKAVVEECLKQAALVNYKRVSEYAKVEESSALNPESQLDMLINLAELCVEAVQQNEEHHYEAFAWFSDLMLDHSELFWSLFSYDMDTVLEKQPPDTWNSFPLFQILNDFLLHDEYLKNGKFHRKLRDTFAPLVIRYVDLMESSIAQTIHRGFGKDSPESEGKESMVAKEVLSHLSLLQTFVQNLQWPDEIFARHLENRLKLMASDMIQSLIARTLSRINIALNACRISFELRVPSKACLLVNVVLECREQSHQLCASGHDESGTQRRYHVEVDKVLEDAYSEINKQIVSRFNKVLEMLLGKLSRYDEGSFTASILTLTKPGMELAHNFTCFVRNNQEMMRNKINDEEFLESLFKHWYNAGVKLLNEWLKVRSKNQLHLYQLKTLIKLFKKFYRGFELEGVDNIKNEDYTSVHNRLTVEEATASVTTGSLGDDVTMQESDVDDGLDDED